jgi:purine nucleosidase
MVWLSHLTAEQRAARLEPPHGPLSMVLDTDTYNEIDDQFALTYALLSPNLSLEAVYAAPFYNDRSSGPGDGMEKSYQEILRVMERLGMAGAAPAYRGSAAFLPADGRPVDSPAARDLIARAMAPRSAPLYVAAIGAITNVTSALLLEPAIADRIVVVWLGGHPPYWPTTREFNLQGDVLAAQVLFDCGVPLVQVPCKNVAEHLRTTLPEMAAYVRGQGAIGDYLYQIFEDYHDDHFAYSKVIWDISTVAYLNHPEWVPSALFPVPVLRNDLTWGPVDTTRHQVRIATDVDRDAVFGDIFRKLAARAQA